MVQYDLLNSEEYPHPEEDQPLSRHRQEPGRVPWSPIDVFIIIALVLAGNFVVFGLIESFIYTVTTQTIKQPVPTLVFLVLQWVVSLGIAFGYLRLRRFHFSLSVLGFRRTPVIRAALMVIAVLIITDIGSVIYEQFVTPHQQQAIQIIQPSLFSLFMSILQIGIIAPVCEETFFRGIIHQGLESRLGFFPAAVLSASIFATAHFQLDIFVIIFLLGFGFAYLIHRTHSLWPSISGHMIYNLLTVIAVYTSLSK